MTETDTFTADDLAILKGEKEPGPAAAEKDAPEPEYEPEGDAAEPVEGAADADDDGDEEPDEGGRVPHGALHRERMKRKEEARRREELEQAHRQQAEAFAQLQQRQTLAEQRLAQILQNLQPQQEAEEPVSFLDAPETYVEKVTERLERLERERQQETEVKKRAQYADQLDRAYLADKEAFKQKAPDVDDAINHLYQSRFNEMKRLGFPEPQIQQALQGEYLNALVICSQKRISPAAYFYQVAQDRGYQPKKAEPAPQPGTVNRTPARSLSAVGGAPAKMGRMSPEDILNMPDDKFATWLEKNSSEFARMMGGKR